MSSEESHVLEFGTPVIIVESLVDYGDDYGLFQAELPKVHAGRLSEPHSLSEGLHASLLLEGPFARVLSIEVFNSRFVLWGTEGERMMIFLSQKEKQHSRICWVMEDIHGILDEAEALDRGSWSVAEGIRTRFYLNTINAFARVIGGAFTGHFYE